VLRRHHHSLRDAAPRRRASHHREPRRREGGAHTPHGAHRREMDQRALHHRGRQGRHEHHEGVRHDRRREGAPGGVPRGAGPQQVPRRRQGQPRGPHPVPQEAR